MREVFDRLEAVKRFLGKVGDWAKEYDWTSITVQCWVVRKGRAHGESIDDGIDVVRLVFDPPGEKAYAEMN